MSIFDKLRTAIDLVESKLQSMNQNATLPDLNCVNEEKTADPPVDTHIDPQVDTYVDPLADELVKKYFEILCGMGETFCNRVRVPIADLTKKRYVEYFLNDVCDADAFDKANELFERSNKDISCCNSSDFELRERRKNAVKSGEYCMDEYEAYRKFCQEEIDAATVEYNNILEVIKDNVNYVHFSQGLRKMTCAYEIQIIVISDSFLSGNFITKELIKQYLMDTYTARINDESYKEYHYVGDDIALLIVKALHFEKYGSDRKNYKTAGYEEYRNFAMSVDEYKRVIDNHPFEKEFYIDKFANRIRESRVFDSKYTSFKGERFSIYNVEDYFCDAACHFLWDEIVRKGGWVNKNDEDISETHDYNELFGIWATCFIQ